MSKQYENQATNGTMVMVEFDTDIIKQDKSTYKGTNIIYKSEKGELRNKGFTTKTYEFKPQLRGELESISGGEAFTLNQYREVGSKFWNVNSVEKGHTAKRSMPAASPQASPPAAQGGSFVNPAAVGQAINLAVSLGLVKTYQEFSPETVANAIASYKAVTDQFTKAWDSAKPEDVEFGDFDDDIPF
jgi:hypothetical protein